MKITANGLIDAGAVLKDNMFIDATPEISLYTMKRFVKDNKVYAFNGWCNKNQKKLYDGIDIEETNKLSIAIVLLKAFMFTFIINNNQSLTVFYKDNPETYTQVSICDDNRIGYYSIEGKVQKINDWILQ